MNTPPSFSASSRCSEMGLREEEIDFMLPTAISETIVASCTASGSNVSSLSDSVSFAQENRKRLPANANILYSELSLFTFFLLLCFLWARLTKALPFSFSPFSRLRGVYRTRTRDCVYSRAKVRRYCAHFMCVLRPLPRAGKTEDSAKRRDRKETFHFFVTNSPFVVQSVLSSTKILLHYYCPLLSSSSSPQFFFKQFFQNQTQTKKAALSLFFLLKVTRFRRNKIPQFLRKRETQHHRRTNAPALREWCCRYQE